MEPKFKFEKLRIWQIAMDFGEEMNDLVIANFPEKEKFNLSSQLMRAVDSIALNISEGAIGQSNPEQSRFMGYAIRSLAEVVTCLHKARRRKYIVEEVFEKHYDATYALMNMMIAFKSKLK
jgi:four helix bundle protein